MSEPAATRLLVVAPGALSSVQDAGRRGLRRVGIPWAGALCDAWRQLANGLLDNPPDAPVIECFEAGLTVRADGGDVRLATAGDVQLERLRPDGAPQAVPAWSSMQLRAGESLRVRSTGRSRVAVLGVAGSRLQPHHGSFATYARAGLGGIGGRTLQAGDALELDPDAERALRGIAERDRADCLAFGIGQPGRLRLRAVPGPQDDAFDDAAIARFFGEDGWCIGVDTDRMGARLDGEPLVHRSADAADIVSDAILPGSVQVPGNGLPIVLANDAHTAGGYPKIATVIGPDLPALALARPGTRLQFCRVDSEAGVQAARKLQGDIEAILQRLVPQRLAPDAAALLRHNLIDGVVDACASEPTPPCS